MKIIRFINITDTGEIMLLPEFKLINGAFIPQVTVIPQILPSCLINRQELAPWLVPDGIQDPNPQRFPLYGRFPVNAFCQSHNSWTGRNRIWMQIPASFGHWIGKQRIFSSYLVAYSWHAPSLGRDYFFIAQKITSSAMVCSSPWFYLSYILGFICRQGPGYGVVMVLVW